MFTNHLYFTGGFVILVCKHLIDSDMSNNSSGGVSLGTVLAIVFIVLKLCGVITWSWLWVLSPIWISFGLAIIVLIFLWCLKNSL